MSREWNASLSTLKAGIQAQPDSTTSFRNIQSQHRLLSERLLESMEIEEKAADLSIKKDKHKNRAETREKIPYPAPTVYGPDETIDLSTKWRPPVESDAKLSVSPEISTSANEGVGSSSNTTSRPSEKLSDHRNWDRPSSHLIRHVSRAARFMESHSMSSCSSPDIVVVSDEENAHLNGHINGFESDTRPDSSDSEMLEMPPLPLQKHLSKEEWQEKRLRISRLREELRSEEMKLVLLKKLHQSQLMKDALLGSAGLSVSSKVAPPVSRSGSTSNSVPPPLVRGSSSSNIVGSQSSTAIGAGIPSVQQPLPTTKSLMSHHTQQPSMMSPLVRGHGPPPPLVMGQRTSPSTSLTSSLMLHQSMLRSSLGHIPRTPVTTPPNMVMGFPLQNLQNPQGTTQNGIAGQNQVSMMQIPPPACPSPSSSQIPQAERMDNQTPAQRQAAAKLALRKQLEKTLLQIPPPKPPPPEMHFIPNANNPEFICLLGLEKVVDFLTQDPSINQPPPEPFECVQCGTDFSPVWKWQDAGTSRNKKPSVICEICVTSNIKKSLKAEHTNRLKTAFVKALQQEQEIEQRMAQTACSSPPPSSSSPPTHCTSSILTPVTSVHSVSTPPSSHSPVHSIPRISNNSAAAAAAVASSAALLQQLPKLSAAHQSLLQAQAQHLQQLAQSLPQPQPAHMIPFAPLLAAQAYSYQLMGKPPVTSTDLQRQYLLDMIPPRSVPQSSMNWKT